MSWHFWNQHKPDFFKPLVVYWINAIGEGYFLEGQYEPRQDIIELDGTYHTRTAFIELDGTDHFTVADGTRWIYKDQFIEFLD
jgi:hypothetical protein